MSLRWVILCPLWASIPLLLCAQRSTGLEQVDTNYVKDFSHLITGRVYMSTKFNTLRIVGTDPGADLLYRPNNQINLGVGFSYRKVTLNLGLRAPFINSDEERYGRTRYLDAQANLLSPERATNLFLQYFKGYHIAGRTTAELGWPDQATELPYRGDVREFNAGVSTMRVYNSRRFSYRAAFNQDAWQRHSAGSWMVGGYATYYGLRADSSLVPLLWADRFERQAGMRRGDHVDVGPMAGYAHTWVVGGHWFFTVSGAVGGGISVQHVTASRDDDENNITSVGPGWRVQGRAGLGYNSRRHQVGLTWNQERIAYLLPQQNTVSWSVGNVRFNVVYRFMEKIAPMDRAVRWLKRKTPAPAKNTVPATDQPLPPKP